MLFHDIDIICFDLLMSWCYNEQHIPENENIYAST